MGESSRDSVGREQHLLHIGRVGHHGEDDVGFLRDFARASTGDAALLHHLLRHAAARVEKELVASRLQMAGHRAAHDSQANKTKIHDVSLFL